MATRDTILQAAVNEIRERDESSFRVTAVAKAAGCATSVLYHYFGSREGLIDAALVQIVIEETHVLRSFAVATSEAAESADDVIELMVSYARIAHDPSRRGDRGLRARLLGAAQSRPAVRQEYARFAEAAQVGNIAVIETLKRKGLVSHQIDSAAAALCMRALDFGWVLDEVNDAPTVDFKKWIDLVRGIATVLVGQPTFLLDASAD